MVTYTQVTMVTYVKLDNVRPQLWFTIYEKALNLLTQQSRSLSTVHIIVDEEISDVGMDEDSDDDMGPTPTPQDLRSR